MSKKRKKTRSDIILPGWESQNVVKCFLKEEKASEKPCEKVGFSHIKRVNKEDIKMKTKFQKGEAMPTIKESCHSYAMRKPGKKIIVLRKKKQPDDKPPQIGKSKPENKGSDNNK